jgi:tetratricopeptide (TPR) repeat protein
MSARSLILCALGSFLACSCSVPRPRASAPPPQASDFAAGIASLERTDPGSPAVLSTKLAYAQFLLSQSTEPCAPRLDLAQEQIGSVDANRSTQVMFPGGWALIANLEYQQHLGRAACGSAADRRDELLAAIEAAHRAVGLYAKAFDYRSMVVMQFDAAVALRRLGEDAAALAALEKTLDLDREFGFPDDARENYKLLLTWRGEPAGAAAVRRLMQDFPHRQVTLKFGWHASDARVTLERRRLTLDGGQTAHSHAAAAFRRRIAAAPAGGWSVSYTHRFTGYEPGVWPSELLPRTPPLVFPPTAVPAMDFKVSATGEFQGVTNPQAFATRLTATTDRLIRASTPPGDESQYAAKDALAKTAEDFSPGMLEADTAQNYQLETAMWIGATLDQGVWYEVTAPLSLSGMSQFVVEQRIEFAFTQWVPCTAGTALRKCVELVIRAAPDEAALSHILEDIGGAPPNNLFVDYFDSTVARLVVDPATLLPYAREERIYWFASLGHSAKDAVLESEHLLSTTTYDSRLTPLAPPSHHGRMVTWQDPQ